MVPFFLIIINKHDIIIYIHKMKREPIKYTMKSDRKKERKLLIAGHNTKGLPT